jgi:prophage maintenance system killer protein
MIDHLTTNDIVHLNERTIRAHGGAFAKPENLREEKRLNDITDEAATDSHLRLTDKAAFYLHSIITQEVFLNATERTALLAARTFVLLNGGVFHKKLKVANQNDKKIPKNADGNQEIWLKLVAQVSSGDLSLENLREWFGRNVSG